MTPPAPTWDEFDPTPLPNHPFHTAPDPDDAPAVDWAAIIADAGNTPPVQRSRAEADHLPADLAAEAQLRERHPWPVVTPLLALVTVAVFAATAAVAGRHEVDTATLHAWGAAHAPDVLAGESWRAVTAVFLHADPGHLAANLLVLLLVGRLGERMLGSPAALATYLLAGVVAAWVAMAWFPTAIQVGASGAVFGLSGAVAGCAVRGWGAVPWRLVGRYAGVVLLFEAAMLVEGVALRRESVVPHLAGLACGFVAGLALGPSGRVRPRGWGRGLARWLVFLAVGGVMLIGAQRLAAWAARTPVATLTALAASTGRTDMPEQERRLMARWDAALAAWDTGDLTDDALRQVVIGELIPGWRPLVGNYNEHRVLPELRAMRYSKPEGVDASPLSAGELAEVYRVYCRARGEAWGSFASALAGERPMSEAVADMLVVENLRSAIDETVNEGNPVRGWLEFSAAKVREEKLRGRRVSGAR